MKYRLLVLILSVHMLAGALPLSPSAKQEAELFTTFLQAAYAQRSGSPQRFALLRKALKQAPNSAYLKQQIVAEALAVDVPELAKPYLDFIEDNPQDPDAWVVYGAYHVQQGNMEQAIEAYEKALSLDPDDERILSQYINVLGYAYPQKAAQTLTELAISYPLAAPMFYTEIGRLYMYHQNYPLALEALNKAISLDGTMPEPRALRAGVYEKTNQYFLMLHELEELEKMGYATAQTYAQMGSIFILVQDYARAEETFLKAKTLEPGNKVAGYFLSLLAEKRGEYSRAVSYLKETSDYASSPTKQVQVSYYQRKLNQPKASFHTLKRAYKHFPDNAEVAYLYGVALYENKKYRQTAQVLAPWVEKSPTQEDIRLQYAFALEGQQKYGAMEEQLGILLEQNPRNAAALNLYAYSLALRGQRLEEAAEYIARALAVWPEDNSFMDTQAWVFYRQSKYAQALDIVEGISPEILTANPEMAYHAGVIYAVNGQSDLAKHYLQLAAEGGWKDAKKELRKYK